MSTNIWKFMDTSSFKGYTLIVPSVAVGNVGQLTCDLLISSLKMKKVASAYSPAFVPVVGYNAYDLSSLDLSTACEIYKSESKKILVLQLRCPLVIKYAKIFLEDLIKICNEKNVRDLVILTSSFAHEKKHIASSPFRYRANETSTYNNKVKTLKWTESELIDHKLRIYGGGFAAMLYEIAQIQSFPTLVLYKYCSEGDNIPDAYEMLNYISLIMPLFIENEDIISQLIQPVSWKFLYGRPAPLDIY